MDDRLEASRFKHPFMTRITTGSTVSGNAGVISIDDGLFYWFNAARKEIAEWIAEAIFEREVLAILEYHRVAETHLPIRTAVRTAT